MYIVYDHFDFAGSKYWLMQLMSVSFQSAYTIES